MQGIGERLTEGGESAAGRKLGAAAMERGTGARVGEEGRSGTGARGEGEWATGADKMRGTRIVGTWPEDGRRRRRVRAARGAKQREEERERLTGGPGGDFYFPFFLGCDTYHTNFLL